MEPGRDGGAWCLAGRGGDLVVRRARSLGSAGGAIAMAAINGGDGAGDGAMQGGKCRARRCGDLANGRMANVVVYDGGACVVGAAGDGGDGLRRKLRRRAEKRENGRW